MNNNPFGKGFSTGEWQAAAAVAAVLAALVAIYYYPFLDNFFAFDDFKYLENNVTGPLQVLLGYGSLRIVANEVWWPLYRLSGMDPAAYNLFSFGMFFLDGLVLYFFVQQLFNDRHLSCAAAVLFVAGSVGSDAIFWKCTNSTLIAFFFYTLSLFWYVKSRQEGNRRFYGISLAAFAFAMFSKEEAASLPGILILLELLVLGERKVGKIAARVAPYCGLILFYLAANRIVFNVLLGVQPEPAKFFQLRPLHSLLTAWSVFFMSPDAKIEFSNPYFYLSGLLLLGAFFFVRERKTLLFACGWIFLTFIPQSFTTLGQLQPKYLVNSVSRYLFLPSAGAALVIALVLAEVGRRWGKKTACWVFLMFMVLYLPLNFSRVRNRGEQWRGNAEPASVFLRELQSVMPEFPPNSYLFVMNPPTGRAFVQQSLRAFYRNPTITWIVDPQSFRVKDGERGFVIDCTWENESRVRLTVFDFVTQRRLYGSPG